MVSSEMVIGVIILSQTVIGVVGNSFLVYNYMLLYFTGVKLRLTDWILQHLISANILTLLCIGIPDATTALGTKYSLSDVECKLSMYVHRVGRGVSLSSTCLLSVSQAITISPTGSRWAQLKVKSPSYLTSGLLMSWILASMVNITFPMYLKARLSHRNMTGIRHFGYCSAVRHDKSFGIFTAIYKTSVDAFFMLLMLWSSSSMVCILYRHKQRMKHIHRSNFSFKSSPETRATKNILFLVSTFVCFYTFSCILQIHMSLLDNPSTFMVSLASVSAACFPTVSPFLLLRH